MTSGQHVLSQDDISAWNSGREEATPPVWSGMEGWSHSSHRQMPSPCTAVSCEECLKQQDMHSQENCTPTGPKYLKLCYCPHSYRTSANSLNESTACWWKLHSSQLKYFKIHFPIVCSRYFLPANGVICSLLLWQWEPGGEGQALVLAGHRDVHLTPHMCRHYKLQWHCGEQREG